MVVPSPEGVLPAVPHGTLLARTGRRWTESLVSRQRQILLLLGTDQLLQCSCSMKALRIERHGFKNVPKLCVSASETFLPVLYVHIMRGGC